MQSIPVTVTTAVKLTADQRKSVEQVVAKKLGKSKFALTEQVDPSVIGGVRLTIESRQYDATVANRFARLNEQLHQE